MSMLSDLISSPRRIISRSLANSYDSRQASNSVLNAMLRMRSWYKEAQIFSWAPHMRMVVMTLNSDC